MSRAQAIFSAWVWQQQSRQHFSAVLHPHGQFMQGNASVVVFSTAMGRGIPSVQAASAATIVRATSCRTQARRRFWAGRENKDIAAKNLAATEVRFVRPMPNVPVPNVIVALPRGNRSGQGFCNDCARSNQKGEFEVTMRAATKDDTIMQSPEQSNNDGPIFS